MPQKKSKLGPPPEAMTWSGALPVIIVAGLFDLVRMFFEMFWFFGPALAAVYCTSVAKGYVGSLFGLTATICSVSAGLAGAAISEITIPLGVVMAMAVGMLGFLSLGLWILMTNARIFKTDATASLWLAGSFCLAEMPLIGTLPAFSMALWKLYKKQIEIEGKALAEWEKQHAAEIARQAKEKVLRLQAQFTQSQVTQLQEQEDQQAADDYDEIPDELQEAA